MNSFESGASLFFAACGLFLMVGALVGTLAVGALRAFVARVSPELRHRLLLLLACAPALVALTLLTASLLPSIRAWATNTADHCLYDTDEHLHLCFVHLPRLGKLIGFAAAVSSFALLLEIASGAFVFLRMRRVHRVFAQLSKTGARTDGVNVVETDDSLCLTAGLWSPSIYISRRLFEALNGEQRRVVIEHERAHAARRDVLAALIAKSCARLHWPSVRDWLLRELELSAEQSCDEAAGQVSDRVVVAETILHVARCARSRPFAVAFGDSSLERRVQSLLQPRRINRIAPYVASSAAMLSMVLANATFVHHAAESILSLLVE